MMSNVPAMFPPALLKTVGLLSTLQPVANSIAAGLNAAMEGNVQERRGMAALPSVDRLLKAPVLTVLIERHGRAPVADAVRSELSSVRSAIVAAIAPSRPQMCSFRI